MTDSFLYLLLHRNVNVLTKELHSRYHSIFLTIALICFVVLGLDQLVYLRYLSLGGFEFNFSPLVQGFLLLGFFSCTFLFVRDYLEKIEIFNVDTLLRMSLVVGTGATTIYYLLHFLPSIVLGFKYGFDTISNAKVVPTAPTLDYIVQYLKPLVILFYLSFSMMLFKKLIFFKKTKWDIIFWNIFQILLIVSLIFCFPIELPVWATWVFRGFGGFIIILLTIRLKWIAFLSTKHKVQSIFYLIGINLITFLLLDNFFNSNDGNILQTDFEGNTFVVFMGGTVLLYSVFSILALIFNLPTSTVGEKRVSEVTSFQELNRFHGSLQSDRLFEKLFNIILENTDADASLMLIKDPLEKYSFYATNGLKGEQVKLLKSQSAEIDNKTYPSVYLNESKEKHEFATIRQDFKSLVHQPLMVNNRKIGDIYILKSFANGFDEYMLRLMRTYIDQTTIALHNVELLDETLENTRLKEDFEIAKKIQNRLLPDQLPNNDDFSISGYYEPALEVGGDYYDYKQEGENSHTCIIADVSGKGTNAAFHVAEMKGVFQSLMLLNLSVEDFMGYANQAIGNCFDKGVFITLAYVNIDTKSKKITFSRAGHCPLLHYKASADKIDYTDDKGLAFGILRNDSYKKHIHLAEMTYESGDILVLYTDGIIEARKENSEEEYGMDRLKESVLKYKNESSDDLTNFIIRDLKQFTGGILSFDDTTLMIIKFK